MNLLEMSFYGSIFIITVVIIRTAAINNLPKKTFLVLWEMVLLRLIIPFTIPSMFSVYTLINRSISASSFSKSKTDNITSTISQKHFAIVQGMEQPPTDNPSVSIWFVVWLVGMILFAAFFTISYLR